MDKSNVSEAFQLNISTILQFIYRNPYTSRIEIANSTGITPAAVTPIISLLLKENVLSENGDVVQKVSGSGRKRKILTLNKDIGIFFGLEFNMKGFFFSATDICGNTLFNIFKDISPTILEKINQTIIEIFSEAREKIGNKKIIGAGIAIPGHYDIINQTVTSNNSMWKEFNLYKIKKEFDFPIIVENNIKSMSFGEYLFNSLNTPDKFSFLHVGHGLFYSYLDSANIKPSLNYYLGEIGHTVVDIDGPLCECGKNGCLQTYISESWILKNAKYLFDNSNYTVLHSLVDSSKDISLKTVMDAYNLNDKLLKNYLEKGVTLLGISTANSLIIQDSSKIFLNSELFENKAFFDQILKTIESQLQFIPTKKKAELEILPYDAYRGSIGACAVACLSFFIKNPNYQF